jgi:hypothetical protein
MKQDFMEFFFFFFKKSIIYLFIDCLRSGSPTCWDCRFESRRVHGCLSVVSVVCFQVQIPATDLPSVMCLSVIKKWGGGERPKPTMGLLGDREKIFNKLCVLG